MKKKKSTLNQPAKMKMGKFTLPLLLISLLGGAFLIGYLIPTFKHREGSPAPSSTANAEEITRELNCPCGNCSDRLDRCSCSSPEGAQEVNEYVQSQIEKELSKEAILSKAVELYGPKVLAKGTKGVSPFVKVIDDLAKIPETLSPETFTGNVARSYQIAREIPEVLLQLPCYCWCDRIGHGSLLDCFVDNHGEDCIICQEEAYRAEEMYKKGELIVAIREKIISEFD